MEVKPKTKAEIEIMREGGRRLATVLDSVEKAIKPGVTTEELNSIAEKLILKGGNKPSFLQYRPEGATEPYPATLCVSVNEEVVHGIPGDREIKNGDIVSIDLGLEHNGFHTDMARTIVVGKVDDVSKKLIEVTKESINIGIREAKTGAHTGDIGFAIESYVQEHGFSIVEELGGHGIGREVHEDPHISNFGKKGAGDELLEGMTIAIEPIVNAGKRHVQLHSDGYTFVTKDKNRSAHFEHTVVVTKNGGDILTKV